MHYLKTKNYSSIGDSHSIITEIILLKKYDHQGRFRLTVEIICTLFFTCIDEIINGELEKHILHQP